MDEGKGPATAEELARDEQEEQERQQVMAVDDVHNALADGQQSATESDSESDDEQEFFDALEPAAAEFRLDPEPSPRLPGRDGANLVLGGKPVTHVVELGSGRTLSIDLRLDPAASSLQFKENVKDDPWSGSDAAQVPLTQRTDGVWRWDDAVSYYVRVYGLSPGAEFLAHVREHGFTPPEVSSAQVSAVIDEVFGAAGDQYTSS